MPPIIPWPKKKVETRDPLVSFLYELLLDHLPAGDVQAAVNNAVLAESGNEYKVVFTNPFLANYAVFIAKLLRKPGEQLRDGETEDTEDTRAPYYVETKSALRCPFCGDEDIEGSSVDIDDTYAAQEVGCNSCGEDWKEVYTLRWRVFDEKQKKKADQYARDNPDKA